MVKSLVDASSLASGVRGSGSIEKVLEEVKRECAKQMLRLGPGYMEASTPCMWSELIRTQLGQSGNRQLRATLLEVAALAVCALDELGREEEEVRRDRRRRVFEGVALDSTPGPGLTSDWFGSPEPKSPTTGARDAPPFFEI